MNPFLAIARGIRAATSSGSLLALCWIYGLLASLAAALTVVLYVVISAGLAKSAVAAQLRSGLSTDWLVDTLGQPGAGAKLISVGLLVLVLALVYAIVSMLLSGGVVARVLGSLAGDTGKREPFLAACGRFAGPMLRVTVIEGLFLAVVGGVLAVVWVAGLAGGAGHGFAWTSAAVFALAIAVVTGVSDVARVHVVATGNRSALSAWRDALSHAVRRAPVFVVVVAFNFVVAAVVLWIAVTLHGSIPRETGTGVIIGLAVGQLGVAGRIWVRVIALATQASLRRLAA